MPARMDTSASGSSPPSSAVSSSSSVASSGWQEMPSLRKLQILAVSNVLFFVVTLGVNGSVGSKIGAVSRENTVILLPTGIGGIWAIIYGWTSVFLVWQVAVAFGKCKRMEKPADARAETQADANSQLSHVQTGFSVDPTFLSPSQRTLLDGVSIWFILSCVFNMLWIVTWTTGTPWGVIASPFLLAALATSLLVVHLRVGKFFWRGRLEGPVESSSCAHKTIKQDVTCSEHRQRPCEAAGTVAEPEAGAASGSAEVSTQHSPPAYELLVLDAPLSIYLGWACAASFLNVTVALQRAIGWAWLAPILKLQKTELDNPAASFAILLLAVATLMFLLVCLPPRRSRALAGLPEGARRLFAPCQGNCLAGFVYVFAALAIRARNQMPTEACRSGELDGVSDVPKACDDVGTTALITGILVALASASSLLLLLFKSR